MAGLGRISTGGVGGSMNLVRALSCYIERLGEGTVLLYIALTGMAVMFGFIVGASSSPRLSSYVIVTAILAYLSLSLVKASLRFLPLVLALTAHIASIATYYSDPLILPFLVVERHAGGYSMNLDIVQALIAYELIITIPGMRCSREARLDTKTLEEESLKGEAREEPR